MKIIEIEFIIEKQKYYDLYLNHTPLNQFSKTHVFINNLAFGEIQFPQGETHSYIGELKLKPGKYSFKINLPQEDFKIISLEIKEKDYSTTKITNYKIRPNLSDNAKRLLEFLQKIYSKYIIAGQHTNTALGPEIAYIEYFTGKKPALRGFDLLSYTPAVRTQDMTPHALIEIEGNKGSIEKAIEWAKDLGGIITLCWHWYAPLGGKDKTFYTVNTDFNLEEALLNGTEENKTLLRDIEIIAEKLSILRDLDIPILWRPLHEADGKWFWWGAKGPENYKKLYMLLYEIFTEKYRLNNLIWIWNAPHPEWKIEKDLYDIAGIDHYAPPGNYGPMKFSYDLLLRLTDNEKLVALTENGPIPDPDLLFEYEAYFLWFMPWFGDFVFNENFNSKEHFKKVYNHEKVITLENLKNLTHLFLSC
ncbi:MULTISPECIES: glycosyl hydrolase [Dictyoglomus]|jgi:mannan endo-1,4-beta-mannosidase|uniref:Mannan endo-1,4-beta-mannosidase n=1 Tax=Dictyoglomus turgidum (strain DSM 6724 / Z-1310) TaxID=515635 RepID=B8DZI4_DICTD|nr:MULTISPECIES: glycosyl hydrolase [Dictyoglomus]ACK41917.1 Mannan endo-1,4-beta-mannosidase [Dictyoglomus turgidum DSM 6724]PNV78727.1 MAG: beta-mannosidase [Dictyoglomus turgidum]HBU31526.1 beta-mannosidase [Dictyoglomus sp.]